MIVSVTLKLPTVSLIITIITFVFIILRVVIVVKYFEEYPLKFSYKCYGSVSSD